MKHEFYLGSKKGKVELEVVDKTSKKQSSGRMAYTLIGLNGDKQVKATVSEEKWNSFEIKKRWEEKEEFKPQGGIPLEETMEDIEALKKVTNVQRGQIKSYIEALRLLEAENDRLTEVVKELEDSPVTEKISSEIDKDNSVFTKIEDGLYGCQLGSKGMLFRTAEGITFAPNVHFVNPSTGGSINAKVKFMSDDLELSIQ